METLLFIAFAASFIGLVISMVVFYKLAFTKNSRAFIRF